MQPNVPTCAHGRSLDVPCTRCPEGRRVQTERRIVFADPELWGRVGAAFPEVAQLRPNRFAPGVVFEQDDRDVRMAARPLTYLEEIVAARVAWNAANALHRALDLSTPTWDESTIVHELVLESLRCTTFASEEASPAAIATVQARIVERLKQTTMKAEESFVKAFFDFARVVAFHVRLAVPFTWR